MCKCRGMDVPMTFNCIGNYWLGFVVYWIVIGAKLWVYFQYV